MENSKIEWTTRPAPRRLLGCTKVEAPALRPKERPILFTADMVKAIVAGRKTQTRRKIKLRDGSLPDDESISTHLDGSFDKVMDFSKTFPYWQELKCPYGQPGDRLWVRETWKWEGDGGAAFYLAGVPEYRAGRLTGQWLEWPYQTPYTAEPNLTTPWHPSIHMPRAASRITLEITHIRAQRLHDMTEADAYNEGFEWVGHGDISTCHQFQEIWEKINGPHSWEQNPWVWAITFRVLSPLEEPVPIHREG